MFNAHCTHAGNSGANVCGGYCENYCGLMGFRCPDGYADVDQCMAACAVLSEDTDLATTGGPSINCRIYHAGAAIQLNDDSHCGHANFNSESTVCGTAADTLCQALLSENGCGNAEFVDEETCVSAITKLPEGATSDTSGNTIDCRAYHAFVGITSALEADFETHCKHAATDGAGVCGSICEAYCSLQLNVCKDNFNSSVTCMTACNAYNTSGVIGDAGGDTLQCRIYHSVVAAVLFPDVQDHCGHSSADGWGVCGGTAPTKPSSTNSTGTGTGTGTTATSETKDDTDTSSVVVATLAFALVIFA
jgi:hypothetical protein